MCLNETCSKVHIGKYLTNNFSVENGVKMELLFWPLLFNFAFEDAIRKIQETQMGLKLNGTHQLLVSANDVNLLGDNLKEKHRL
jgi:hypothetical protein